MSDQGALPSLSNYGDDSPDDDDPEPNGSTKRSHTTSEASSSKKIKLPPPNFSSDSQPKEPEHVDDPNLHEGRVRSFPHERGNWVTLAYIPYTENNIDETLDDLSKHIQMEGLKKVEELHVSLTKTVILKHHWINPFIESIKDKIGRSRKFMILFENLDIYCNEERTRTFLALKVKTGQDSLVKLVEILDLCMQEFELPVYYENPSFHMSIGYYVGDVEEELKSKLADLNYKLGEVMEFFGYENFSIYVDAIFCKIGNKLFSFTLY